MAQRLLSFLSMIASNTYAWMLAWMAISAPQEGPVERRVSLGNTSTGIDTHAFSDGNTLLLVGSSAAINRALPQLRRDGRPEKRELPRGRVELLLRASLPIREVDFAKGALDYTLVNRRTQIVDHLTKRIRRPLPTDYTFKNYRRSERSIARGDYRAAEKRLRRLLKKDELRDFALLRLADIDYIKGDTTTACAEYAQLRRDNAKSVAGTFATLRSHTVLCPGTGYEREAWDSLLGHILRVGGDVGAALWSEALWTLSLAESQDAMRLVIALTERYRGSGDYPMPGVDGLRRTLLGRVLFRNTSPAASTKDYLGFAREIGQHPERRHLELKVARAFLASGLPERAAALLEPLVDEARGDVAWNDRNGRAQAHRALVDAYAAAGWSALARDMAESYSALYGEPVPNPSRVPGPPYVTPVAADLRNVESRLDVLERFLRRPQ